MVVSPQGGASFEAAGQGMDEERRHGLGRETRPRNVLCLWGEGIIERKDDVKGQEDDGERMTIETMDEFLACPQAAS